MSFGKLNAFIEIISAQSVKDSDGFAVKSDNIIASVRAYFEPKNTTEKWRNNAAFTEASALFRFRKIPGLEINSSLYIICEEKRYRIISAEDVRGRGMYIEVLADKSESTVR